MSYSFRELIKLIGEKAREIIGETLENFDGKKGRCNSGFHADDTPSMTWFPEGLKFYCQSCRTKYDISDHYRKLYPNDYKEKLHELAGVTLDKSFKLKSEILCNFGRDWLSQRGIKGDFGKHVTSDSKNIYFNCFEYGKVINIKTRVMSKKQMWQIKGQKTQLFLKEYDIDYDKELYLTEGDPDALVLRMLGYQSVSYGSVTAISLLNRNLEWLSKFPRVIIICDNDKAGKGFYDKIGSIKLKNANKLLIDKENDVNDLLILRGEKELRTQLQLFEKCTEYEEQAKKDRLRKLEKKQKNIELREYLRAHFRKGNIFRVEDKYLVVNPKGNPQPIYTDRNVLNIISASGLDVGKLGEDYDGFGKAYKEEFANVCPTFYEITKICNNPKRKYNEVFEEDGQYYLNKYNNTGLMKLGKSKKVKHQEFEDIHKHLSDLCGEYIEFIYDLIAYNIQFPENLTKTSVIIRSYVQGVGKGLLYLLLEKIFGFENCVSMNAKGFQSNFNGASNKKIICLEESNIYEKSGADILKNLIADKFVYFEEKWEKSKKINNIGQYWIFSNRNIPVYLEPENRRTLAIHCSNEMNPEFGVKLELIYTHKKHPQVMNFINFCLNRKVSIKNIYPAPKTKCFWDIVELSKSRNQSSIESLCDNLYENIDHMIRTTNKFEYLRNLKREFELNEKDNTVRIKKNDFIELVFLFTRKRLDTKQINRYIKDIDNIEYKGTIRIKPNYRKTGYLIHLKEKEFMPKPDIKKKELQNFPEEKKVHYEVEGATYVGKTEPKIIPLFGEDFDPSGWEKTEHQFDRSDE